MGINRITAGVQVRKDFGKCFDFYTKKLGLIPVYGDRTGPYTSFASSEGEEPFFAIYEAKDSSERVKEYIIPSSTESSDTLTAVFHTTDFDKDYNRLLELGVQFIGKEKLVGNDYEFSVAYFRDTEGNLLSLEDGGV
ncbi:MAG: VOC family protein [Oscillospiraceae bacterium]|nr:VOC family protein [Oscillospiraceae bacterium]